MPRSLRLALAPAAALALLVPTAALAEPNDPEAAAAAAAYIADQVPEDGNLGGAGGTADAVLALLAAGGHDAEVDLMTDYLESAAESYAGGGGPAAGKIALVAAATGRDATDFGGVDLIGAIEGSIGEDGVCGSWAYALGNALCILGLDRNDVDVPAELLENSYEFQDDETGAYGYFSGTDFTPDNDASGLMLSALAGVADDRDAAFSAAAVRDYLIEAQTGAGYWENFSPVNTTGLVAPSLETVGVPQDLAVTWMASQQLEDGGLPATLDGTSSSLMATTQGILPFTGESYLSVGEGGTDQVELIVNPSEVVRVAGANRYETAVEVSAEFDPGVETVYLASGQVFADALAGSALAGSQAAPLLLSRADLLPSATAAELDRLQPEQVVVLGGADSVADAVLEQVAEVTDAQVTRVAGTDRYGTAADLAAQFEDPEHVYVATGLEYADALAASAAGAREGAPVLLVQTGHIPSVTADVLEDLAPTTLTVLGGEAAVSDDVEEALGAYADEVVRVAGDDRYATAALLSAQQEEGYAGAIVTDGTNWPDALTGAVASGTAQVPVLLVQPENLPLPTSGELFRYAADHLVVLGGEEAVSGDVLTELAELNYVG